jgi:hypothetical protein
MLLAMTFFLVALLIAPAFAQDTTAADPAGDATAQVTPSEDSAPAATPPAAEEPLEPKAPEYEDMPQVELRILDKVRAESRTYLLNVGRTVAYANIRIRPRACRKSSPLDDPEDAAFLQIWEVKPDGVSAWIFSGWMFASSPSLSAMDHPVYDVTVLDCRDTEKESQSQSAPQSSETTSEEAPAETAPSAAPANETPAGDSAPASSE